jgi:hypothetical protein
MTTPLYIVQGRLGDCLSLAPLFYAEHQRTGEKIRLMVAKEFSSWTDGCTYIDPIIFDGDYLDLEGAVKFARTLSDNVIVTSLHGTNEELERYTYSQVQSTGCVTSNFQLEQWNLAGRAKEFYDNLPLVFDARCPEREKRLLDANGILRARKPILLLALSGVTAGFEYADLLRDYVTAKFGKDYRVIDFPMVENPDGRIYDLLAILEKSALLITTDSMPLHLAWAVRQLPVFALTNDRSPDGKPSLWHGSPWRPNHLWYCRYSDWPARAKEMMDAVKFLSARPLYDKITEKSVWVWVGDMVGPYISNGDLPIKRGMCSRELNGAPFLKDVIRMGLQRTNNDATRLLIKRDAVEIKPLEKTPEEPFFSYRTHNGQHIPIIDLFSAPKSFWKTILPEVPDLLLDNSDPWWSEALLAVFKKHGAKDASGCAEFVGGEK